MSPPGPTSPSDGPYRQARIAVGTRHGKQHQFAPAFADVLGAVLVTPADLDTDRFGTFSGETPRTGTPREAARAKARLAMETTGLPLALASEASYAWHGHEEILLFCDDAAGIEVLEGYRTATVPGAAHRVRDASDVSPALLAGLPDQGLIVRVPDAQEATVKGITDPAALRAAITTATARHAEVIVEPDLRAHLNPTRREVLSMLAERMARRLATHCPQCAAPGFGRVDSEPGLPCGVCGTPTALAAAEIHGCAGCAHTVRLPVARPHADASECGECNP